MHALHFLEHDFPIHIDATFVPLRPPRGLEGTEGLALWNPERPPNAHEMRLWEKNNWRLVEAATPAGRRSPPFIPDLKWLSMNLLSLSEKCLLVQVNASPRPVLHKLIVLWHQTRTRRRHTLQAERHIHKVKKKQSGENTMSTQENTLHCIVPNANGNRLTFSEFVLRGIIQSTRNEAVSF